MRRMIEAAALIVVLSSTIALAAGNGVTIEAEDMPLPELVNLLRQMTGTQIFGENAGGAEAPRITIKFEDAPLKTVIREVCGQAGWHFAHVGGTYHLMPGVETDQAPRCLVGPYEIVVDSLSVQRTRSLNLRNPARGPRLDERLSIQLVAQSDDDEAMVAVLGFDPNVTCVTDTGAKLEPLQKDLWGGGHGFESTVQGWLSLGPPPEGAKQIATLEGDLVLYAKVDRAEVEFTPDEVGATKQAGDVSVKLEELNRQTGFVRIQTALPRPAQEFGQRLASIGTPAFEVSLLDGQGKAVPCSGRGYSGGGGEGVYRYDQQYSFQLTTGFVPAKLRYRMSIPRHPSERQTYTFENLPLPLEEAAAPPVDQLP